MNVEIIYYAMFREQAGCGSETLHIESADASELFESLQKRHGFTLSRCSVRLAINDAFVDWNTPLKDGDSLVFIPPVAGG